MECDCTHSSLKTYTRVDHGQNPPVVIGTATVQIDSTCIKLPERDGQRFIEPSYGQAQVSANASETTEKDRPCYNYISVTLVRATAGWTITEVQVGGDVFLSKIAVGKPEQFVLSPCASCEKETISVKVTDAAGVVQATIGGLKACHCQTA